MKNYAIIFCLLLISCTKEDKVYNIEQFVENRTTSNLIITFKSDSGVEVNSVSITAGSSYSCNFNSEVNIPSLYECSDVDTSFIKEIQFTFDNGKGYRCTSFESNSLCISGQTSGRLRIEEESFELRDGKYYFTITQQDLDNAFDLP